MDTIQERYQRKTVSALVFPLGDGGEAGKSGNMFCTDVEWSAAPTGCCSTSNGRYGRPPAEPATLAALGGEWRVDELLPVKPETLSARPPAAMWTPEGRDGCE